MFNISSTHQAIPLAGKGKQFELVQGLSMSKVL